MKKIKHIYKIIFLTILIGLFVGYIHYYYKKLVSEKTKLEQEIKNLSKLKIRGEKIKSMEKTMMIHYKLSWYEAHYYAVMMYDWTTKYDIPWQIYAAVIRIESNFDPTKLSNKGARGMTQVLESTGKSVAEKLGIEWKPKNTLWNEIPNMAIGFTYLSEAIKDSGFEKGIGIYIGGPGFNKSHKVVGDYQTTVKWEYERLRYIHAGVLNADLIKYEEEKNTETDTINGND